MVSDKAIRRPWAGPYLWALPAALILMAFALVNTYAVFFIDSRSYVRSAALAADAGLGTDFARPWRASGNPRPLPGEAAAVAPTASPVEAAGEASGGASAGDEKFVNSGITANRSIYYGALAFVGYATSDFWLLIFIQAYAAAACMALTMLRVMAMRPAALLATSALVSVFTSVGAFVAYVMPDIFGATVILGSITLLLGWRRLKLFDRVVLAAIVAFSALAHNSNVLLLAAIGGAWLVWIAWQRQLAAHWPRIATLALLLAAGPVGLAAFGYAIKQQTGEAPLVLPHLTAHLVDLGPGTAYAKHHCPDDRFAVCEFRDILPVTWTQFIGGARDAENGVFAVADLPTKRRLSDEQLAFALAVFTTYPLETTLGMLKDGTTQLFTLTIQDMKVDELLGQYFQVYMPPGVQAGIAGSTIYRHPSLLDVMDWLTYISAALASIYLLWFLYRERRAGWSGDGFLTGLVVLLFIAYIANAVICGMLASPMGRFSGRIVWLLPFAALMVAMAGRYFGVRAGGLGSAHPGYDEEPGLMPSGAAPDS